MSESAARKSVAPAAWPALGILATLLGACSTGAGFDGHSPQVVDTSGRTRSALQACLAARLGRYGTPTIEDDRARVVLRYETYRLPSRS
jgi:hypothetical protein